MPPYARWTRARWIGAGVTAAACGAVLLIPAASLDDRPRFAIGKEEARGKSDVLLRERGLKPEQFSSVVSPSVRFDPAVAGKYILEHRTPQAAGRLFESNAPVRVWSVRYFRPLDKEEVRVDVNPETGRVIDFNHELPEDRAGADITGDAARDLAARELTGHGFDLSAMVLKESASEKKKARRDHKLVWEARDGDPRNVDEAHFRLSVEVAGDRVVSWQPYWKIPEVYQRERTRSNGLSIGLAVLRILFWAVAVVSALYLLAQLTRRREVRWRWALLAAAPVTALALIAFVNDFPQIWTRYPTEIPVEVFQGTMIGGMAMGTIGIFIAITCAAALISGLRTQSATDLSAANRAHAGLDAAAAALLAVLIAAAGAHLAGIARDRLHALALFGVPEP